ncbi:MAG TPA: hypothetical protein PLH42_06215, partial [bacterium]|nr:hypothetical protein [bacterium]
LSLQLLRLRERIKSSKPSLGFTSPVFILLSAERRSFIFYSDDIIRHLSELSLQRYLDNPNFYISNS